MEVVPGNYDLQVALSYEGKRVAEDESHFRIE
jgi:hypothetical protein